MNSDLPAIEMRNVTFSYKNKKTILRNINLSVKQSNILTILGPNGVGKTTLLNCILRNVLDFSGNINLFGKDIKQFSPKEYASIIAYVPQFSQLSFDYTVEEFVLMGCTPRKTFFAQPQLNDYNIVYKSLTELGINNLRYCHMTEISGGERQLVYFARALVQQPKIIVLDEPTSSLDYSNQYKLLNNLKYLNTLGYTIILTSHNPEYAFMLGGDVAMLFKEGDFIYGCVEELMTEEHLTEMYKIDIKVKYISEYDSYICIRVD